MDEALQQNLNEPNKWFSNLYERFNNDVQLLFEKETLWESCLNCPDGQCCQRVTIPVMGPEWDNIIKYVKSNFNRINKRRFETNVERGRFSCPFFFRNSCAVYSVRPWSCRIYPYTISFFKSLITFQNGDFFAPSCSSLAPKFGIKTKNSIRYEPTILERLPNSNLVNIQINPNLSFWIIDITKYQDEYENKMPKNEDGTLLGDSMHNWVGIPKLLRDSRKINQSKFLYLLGLE